MSHETFSTLHNKKITAKSNKYTRLNIPRKRQGQSMIRQTHNAAIQDGLSKERGPAKQPLVAQSQYVAGCGYTKVRVVKWEQVAFRGISRCIESVFLYSTGLQKLYCVLQTTELREINEAVHADLLYRSTKQNRPTSPGRTGRRPAFWTTCNNNNNNSPEQEPSPSDTACRLTWVPAAGSRTRLSSPCQALKTQICQKPGTIKQWQQQIRVRKMSHDTELLTVCHR